MKMATSCILKCVNQIYLTVKLPNLNPVIIGRSPETKIKDKRCSKTQVEFEANYETYSVKVKQIGNNSCGFNGRKLVKEEELLLYHQDIFEILFGQYPYQVIFTPAPTNNKEDLEKMPKNIGDDKRKKRTLNTPETVNKKIKSSEGKNSDIKSKVWESFEDGELLVLNKANIKGSKKIASYDMDGTLITTVSGRVFPKDNNDWKIIFSEVPGKLKKLNQEGYKIVIFTNQAGIAIGKNTVEGIQTKISRIIDKMGIQAQALISTGKSKYRKPMTGMWKFFIQNCNENMEVDRESSFYVGDAAGRLSSEKQKKKDHSCADRLFAINLDIPFYTPEEHFLGRKPALFKMPDFIPSKLMESNVSLLEPSSTKIPGSVPEVILMVGCPGSGKSFFCEQHLLKHGYVQVNRDTLGSWQKCVAGMDNAIKDKKSVVIDNTNPDKETRKRYIDIATQKSVPIRCFISSISVDHAKHNNKFRELSGSGHAKINDMIYNMYKSKYEEPSLQEGFSEIVHFNFKPHFLTKESEQLYKMFLLEK